ncbi:MAG: flagellar hook-length control protein FliK [Candidatus Puniceispirillaceae bacterium]
MSEIASKANARPSSSLAQPFVKKGGDAAHEMLFAALFGGVVAAEPDADPMIGGLGPVNADADTDANPDGNSDILAAMQAVAAMMAGQRGTGRSSESEADVASQDDILLVDEDDFTGLDGKPDEDMIPINPMMIGPMPLQQQAGTALPAAETSAVMAQMAMEDEAVMPHQHKGRAALGAQIPAAHQSSVQSQMQMAALSSSSPQTMKSAEKQPSHVDPIDDMLTGELDVETSQLRTGGRPDARSDARPVIRPATYQQTISQASLANSKSVDASDQALIDMDGDMQFDSPDDFMRAVAGQTERVVGRMSGQSVSGESLSANAVRQMQAAGVSVAAQMSQQNNGQSGGQSGGLVSASAGMTNGSMMDMLDMAQDNWTEMLLQRVERGLAGGKDKIDFHLNPRNLGKMRISLVVQNERTNVHIQTETSAAAQMLSDAEARLAQMMDASGLKFGNLTSQYNQNFGGNFAGQNSGRGREGGSAHAAASDTADGKDETNAEISVEQSENLINMQA